MSDAVISLEAADSFALGGNFIPQNTTATVSQENAKMIKANGDYQKLSAVFNILTSVTTVYKFNADTGLGTALPKVGEVKNAYEITEISVKTTYNDYPEITITGHQHAENPHADDRNKYSISASIIPLLTGAFGAYDLFGKTSATACVTDSNYTLGVNHIDTECSDGDHFVGQNIQGLETASVTYIGIAGTPTTVAGWTVTSAETSDSNVDFDKSTITAERLVLRD